MFKYDDKKNSKINDERLKRARELAKQSIESKKNVLGSTQLMKMPEISQKSDSDYKILKERFEEYGYSFERETFNELNSNNEYNKLKESLLKNGVHSTNLRRISQFYYEFKNDYRTAIKPLIQVLDNLFGVVKKQVFDESLIRIVEILRENNEVAESERLLSKYVSHVKNKEKFNEKIFKISPENKTITIEKKRDEVKLDQNVENSKEKQSSSNSEKNVVATKRVKESIRTFSEIARIANEYSLTFLESEYNDLLNTSYKEMLKNRFEIHKVLYAIATFLLERKELHKAKEFATKANDLVWKTKATTKEKKKYPELIQRIDAESSLHSNLSLEKRRQNTPSRSDVAASNIFKKANALSIEQYLPSINSYIKNSQFKYYFDRVEEDDVPIFVIEKIKSDLATKLKYLDFEIREKIFPYIIKIESNIRYAIYNGVLKPSDNISLVLHNDINTGKIDLIENNILGIMDVDKVIVAESSPLYDKPLLLFELIFSVLSIVRNHIAHGNLNIFDITITKRLENKISNMRDSGATPDKTKPIDFEDYSDYVVSLDGTDEKRVQILNALFDLEITKKVLSERAINERRIFGFAIVALFLANKQSIFIEIAASIEKSIAVFKASTSLGAKKALYDALGLREDWINAFNMKFQNDEN